MCTTCRRARILRSIAQHVLLAGVHAACAKKWPGLSYLSWLLRAVDPYLWMVVQPYGPRGLASLVALNVKAITV